MCGSEYASSGCVGVSGCACAVATCVHFVIAT